jgi:hypothetical protein
VPRFQLIPDLDAPAKPAPRQYQEYEADLGLERATVLVPLERAAELEAAVAADATLLRSKARLRRVVERLEGEVT